MSGTLPAMPRRSRGEGTVYQRKDGRWVAVVHLGYEGPRRLRRFLYARTKAEAKQLLAEAQRNVAVGLSVPSVTLTVAQYLARWLEVTVAPSVRPATLRSYSQIVAQHLVPVLGRIPLSKLTVGDVQGYLGRASGSARSVQYHHAVLRSALRQAEREGAVYRNVATFVSAPRVDRDEVRPLTREEVGTFLEAVRGDRLEALYVLCLTVGLRQGEALGLLWENVEVGATLPFPHPSANAVGLTDDEDFRGHFTDHELTVPTPAGRGSLPGRAFPSVTVRFTLSRREGRFYLDPPKTKRSVRTVALPEVAAAALRRRRTRQKAEKLAAGTRWGERGFLFTTATGEPLVGTSITHEFQRHLVRAGLPKVPFHALRHTAATMMREQGTDMRVVQQVLGHASMSTTADTYSHVTPVASREVAERMDRALASRR